MVALQLPDGEGLHSDRQPMQADNLQGRTRTQLSEVELAQEVAVRLAWVGLEPVWKALEQVLWELLEVHGSLPQAAEALCVTAPLGACIPWYFLP